jgi:hypothetical protein
MKFGKYINEERPSKMVQIKDIIKRVKSHKGEFVAYAAGFGAYHGTGEMPIDKKRLLKNLTKSSGESFLQLELEGNILRLGYALSFLSAKNFDKFFPK